jgi:hypothetical protein
MSQTDRDAGKLTGGIVGIIELFHGLGSACHDEFEKMRTRQF